MERRRHEEQVRAALAEAGAVALLGPRQVGKTTLARALATEAGAHFFDLESPRDLARLADPLLALEDLEGLVVIDEVQRRPDLFPVLRVLLDRRPRRAHFLLLGSAAPDVARGVSETLAGRIAFHELRGFALDEVGAHEVSRLWVRGGLPDSFLAASDAASWRWRRAFVSTFLERDLGMLGVSTPPETMRRFWTMLAHLHGQVWNAAEPARALGVAEKTARRHLDSLVSTFVVRRLAPWFANVGKREVKAPKIYVTDTGLLHALLSLQDRDDLLAHPKVGASWEGFVIGQLCERLGAAGDEAYFWGVHTGAELDLFVVRGRARRGFEIKLTDAPHVTPSMRSALDVLGLDSLDVVHGGPDTFPLAPRIRAVSARRLWADVEPLP